jgi:hypothetical protein
MGLLVWAEHWVTALVSPWASLGTCQVRSEPSPWDSLRNECWSPGDFRRSLGIPKGCKGLGVVQRLFLLGPEGTRGRPCGAAPVPPESLRNEGLAVWCRAGSSGVLKEWEAGRRFFKIEYLKKFKSKMDLEGIFVFRRAPWTHLQGWLKKKFFGQNFSKSLFFGPT